MGKIPTSTITNTTNTIKQSIGKKTKESKTLSQFRKTNLIVNKLVSDNGAKNLTRLQAHGCRVID